MNIIKKFWVNFKDQPDIWFFYGFLLTFTLSLRKVLFFYPINDQFNEYTGIYLYLSDIFLVLALVSWIISILHNNIDIKSRYNSIKSSLNKPFIIIPAFLVVWSFVSTIWSDNQGIALFRSVKLLEFYLLYIYLILKIVPSQNQCSVWNMLQNKYGTILRNIFKITIFLGIFHSIVGIWQFFIQRSVGLFWLKESLISPEIPGVAKIILDGERFIRSYGLFPHPNILGGFLVFSIIITLLYYKLFHVEKLNNKRSIPDRYENVPYGTFLGRWNTNGIFHIFLIIQIIALTLTFSKSAILGLILASAYIFIKMYLTFVLPLVGGRSKGEVENVPYGTNIRKMFHMEHFPYKKVILVVLIIVLLIFSVKPDIYTFFLKSANERLFYLNVSPARIALQSIAGGYETLNNINTLVFGIGQGQFVTNLLDFPNILNWQFQPVHNVYLLILNELGIIGLALFLWFLLATCYKFVSPKKQCSTCLATEPRRAGNIHIIFKAIFLAFLFIMLFDHYLWDIQQGQILFWISMGLLAISNKNFKEQKTFPSYWDIT